MSKRKRPGEGSTGDRNTQDVGDYSRTSDTFSKLDQATLDYYKEIRLHLDGLTDEEQRSMLAANALEETKGALLSLA